MDIKIEVLPETRIAYFRRVGEYGADENKKLMESFKEWVKLKGLFKNGNGGILGIPQDNPQFMPKDKCRYDVCISINDEFNVTKPAKHTTLPGGTYAVFLMDHTKEAIHEFWDNIYSELGKNNIEIDGRPMMERYRLSMIENNQCEILIPIKDKSLKF